MNLSQKKYVFGRIESICEQLFRKFSARLDEEFGPTELKNSHPFENDEVKVCKHLTDLISGKIKPEKFPYILSEEPSRYARLYELFLKKDELLKNQVHNKKMREIELKKEELKSKARKFLDREEMNMKDRVMLGDSESVIDSLEAFSKSDLWKAVV